MSQEGFVKQGNAICEVSISRVSGLRTNRFSSTIGKLPIDEAAIRAFYEDTVIPDMEKQFDALDRLQPPKSTEKKFDQALKAGRSALARAKSHPLILLEDNGVEADSFEKAEELMKAAGLDACAEHVR